MESNENRIETNVETCFQEWRWVFFYVFWYDFCTQRGDLVVRKCGSRSRSFSFTNHDLRGIISLGVFYCFVLSFGGWNMAVSYNNLWKLMIDKKTNKSELCKTLKISSSTMAKMTNEEMVAMSILEKICAELDCNIGDIVEFTKLDEVKKKTKENI